MHGLMTRFDLRATWQEVIRKMDHLMNREKPSESIQGVPGTLFALEKKIT